MRAFAVFLLVLAGAAQATPMRASYYGAESGTRNADGSRFVPGGRTIAHRTLPFGTRLEVCLRGCAIGIVRDRGPFVRGRDIDLSQGLARAIGLEAAGVATIDVEILGQPPSRPRGHRR